MVVVKLWEGHLEWTRTTNSEAVLCASGDLLSQLEVAE